MKSFLASVTFCTAATLATGCGKSADSYSLLSDASSYKQNSTYIPRKVDVLWVIDNSGSMQTSQQNLTDHFQAFIQRFQQTDSDFHMAVTTSDAYLAPYDPSYATYSRIRDGVTNSDMNVHSGVFVMTKATPNLNTVFLKNITQGIRGSGDERVHSSMEATLSDPWNNSFRRPGAFLAVIMVTDEDDFSHNGLNMSENYNDSSMIPAQHYLDFLTNLTAFGGSSKNFSVNAITIVDSACRAQLTTGSQKISTRVAELVNGSGGQLVSLCSDFSTSLQSLSNSIIELSSSFQLTRVPLESTLVISVGGSVIPRGSSNGWTYDAGSNSIVFHGTSIPAAGADITVNFDPATIRN
ncbi:MAG: hypothetical protein EOP06_13265 [Proteobacteria bacterium]|nr:MAG: hypothetical protein EOP06_13265 [Pseudomonadota bacterium]